MCVVLSRREFVCDSSFGKVERGMSNKNNEKFPNEVSLTEERPEVVHDDPLTDISQVIRHEIPRDVNRRNFLMRSAVVGAAAVMTGRHVSARERTLTVLGESLALPQATGPAPPLSADLDVVKKGKGPVLTTLDEFYKVG